MNCVGFNIRRAEYPSWFAGHNGVGSCWCSSQDSALLVPQPLLIPALSSLHKEKELCAHPVWDAPDSRIGIGTDSPAPS